MKNTQKGFIVPLVIAIVAILAVGGGVYAYKRGHSSPVAADVKTETQTESQTSEASTEGTLSDLLGIGSSKVCDVSFTVPGNSESKGTIYVSSGKLRGDYTTVASGQTFSSHVIMDGTTSYTWMDGMPMGFKTSVSGNASAGTPSKAAIHPDQKVRYTCRDTAADASHFAVPTSINFNAVGSVAVPQSM